MNTNALKRILGFLLITIPLGISTTVYALPEESRLVQQSSLPQITYLGQGPQTFTIEPPLKFFVKTYQNGKFIFVAHDGPTYEAEPNERVWTIDSVPAESIRLFDESKDYGNVEKGCVVNFVQIEDNIDSRRNTFFINGNPLLVVEQGMVTYGSFTVPEAGDLTFFAEDSIGMILELCQNVQTLVPSTSPTIPPQTATDVASTPTPTLTSTVTLAPSEITNSPSETPTITPTTALTAPGNILTLTPSITPQAPTSTGLPTSPGPSATPQIVLITATPIATMISLPVTGGEPGPHEIANISLTIIGIFLLVGAAWWFLVRAYIKSDQ
jgi:hypothetical protein